jgi:2-polyprenyl-3-methyl-5-hydroxy-6-metoxy-1,4-benzoquinol methylase
MFAAIQDWNTRGPHTWLSRCSRERTFYTANGPLWYAYHLLDRSTAKINRLFERRVHALELERGLPGMNTVDHMRHVWTAWDWSQGGEEWNMGTEWRRAVVDDLILPYVTSHSVTLEVGPGAGRWSAALQAASAKLILVDITEISMELCRERFAECSNVEYRLTDGAGLPGMPDETIDFIWSFDVFVHIAPQDQRAYMRDFARVMRPGAKAVIHHAGQGGLNSNQRSSMTAELFARLAAELGLRLIDQFDRWGDNGIFGLPVAGDVISIIER